MDLLGIQAEPHQSLDLRTDIPELVLDEERGSAEQGLSRGMPVHKPLQERHVLQRVDDIA
jgi:hypothetical protein